MADLPETVLQFGAGNFLRAFTDAFVHESNQRGDAFGRVVVVQSTESNRAELLNAQHCRYHVAVRGIENGAPVDRIQAVTSVSRALVARHEWGRVLEVAESPNLRWIVSNTTEAGYDLDDRDALSGDAPESFPAKLLCLLHHRYRNSLSALTILPCELFERNADRLSRIVVDLALRWGLEDDFRSWLTEECLWLNNLVDRIVTGKPKEHPLLAEDSLLTVAEPFALWVVEQQTDADQPKPMEFLRNDAIVRTDDVDSYYLRKVRILNGVHSALVMKAMPLGFMTVREVIADAKLGEWVRELLYDEIVPTLDGRVDGAQQFADQTIERFLNPFIDHDLEKIALHHEAKVKVRLVPTREEFVERFGRRPRLLDEVLAETH